MRFEELQVSDPFLRALSDKEYEQPTTIQKKTIPLILKRHDILGTAQTGTGKTAAFSIPILQLIHDIEGRKKGKPILRALIISPTRELAIQIGESIEAYGKYTSVKHAVICGGVNQSNQVYQLRRGVHILVATPGRLLDLINQGHILLESIKIFVLDEADRMLDMGFIHDVRKLIKLIPRDRQTLLFSATMPVEIEKLSTEILNNPVRVEASPASSAPVTIKQYVYRTNRTSKMDLLLHILRENKIKQVLLFVRTKRSADKVAKILKKQHISSAAIHGDKAQNNRQRVLGQFKQGDLRVLVATDIAARGIDIDKLKFVINYDIPHEAETYVHRIGRCGRAGEDGIAISLCEPEHNIFVKEIEKLLGYKLHHIKDNPFPQTDRVMSDQEKKEWNKEKQRRQQSFFTQRRKAMGQY